MSEAKPNNKVFFGGAWIRQDKNGNEYLSASAGGKGNTLYLVTSDGKQIELNSFAIVYNKNKREGKQDPDMVFMYSPKPVS